MQASEVHVSVPDQRLDLLIDGKIFRSYAISTALNGIGTEPGSNKTPTGQFRIAEMIGHEAPLGMVFRSRVPTGEIGTEDCEEDLIQTRILWLDGLEAENANTYSRYIYIHGTNHEADLGKPVSHGCVRMSNSDIAELFAYVQPGTPVRIWAGTQRSKCVA